VIIYVWYVLFAAFLLAWLSAGLVGY